MDWFVQELEIHLMLIWLTNSIKWFSLTEPIKQLIWLKNGLNYSIDWTDVCKN